MLRQTIKYIDFNGDETEEVLYFNLSKTEAVELELGFKGGLESEVKRLVEAGDNLATYRFFKGLVLKAYGHKSGDGKRFIKNDTIREEFEQSAAFEEFVFKLMNDETGKTAMAFFTNIMPREIRENLAGKEIDIETTKAEIDKLQSDGVY